jgi:uncharacterized LabA/DUF88 family protein
MKDDSHRIALFIDFDNIEVGVRTSLGQHFKISVLLEALKEKGAIISKRAYGDWQRFPTFTRDFGDHGVEMVQRVTNYSGDKNGADINIAVDAMELALTNEHIDVFAIASGDSDFLPLITRLKLHNKLVYVIGGLTFTSGSIQKNCTEFIAYENLIKVPESELGTSQRRSRSLPVSNVAPTLSRALDILEERGATPTSGVVKSCMLQLDPTFDERSYGFSTFGTFLRALEKNGLIGLETNSSGGGYVVSRPTASPAPAPAKPEKPAKETNAEAALELARKATIRLAESGGRRYVPASLFKRHIREIDPSFDERAYGFARFSTFLKFAKEKGVLNMARGKNEAMVAPPALKPGESAAGVEEGLAELDKPAARAEGSALMLEGHPTPQENAGVEAPPTSGRPEAIAAVASSQEIEPARDIEPSSRYKDLASEPTIAEKKAGKEWEEPVVAEALAHTELKEGKAAEKEPEKAVTTSTLRKRAARGTRRTTRRTKAKPRGKTAKEAAKS